MWDSVIEHFGGQSGLSRAIGEPQSTISYKIVNGHPIPAEWVPRIVAASGDTLTRAELRPDLWSEVAA